MTETATPSTPVRHPLHFEPCDLAPLTPCADPVPFPSVVAWAPMGFPPEPDARVFGHNPPARKGRIVLWPSSDLAVAAARTLRGYGAVALVPARTGPHPAALVLATSRRLHQTPNHELFARARVAGRNRPAVIALVPPRPQPDHCVVPHFVAFRDRVDGRLRRAVVWEVLPYRQVLDWIGGPWPFARPARLVAAAPAWNILWAAHEDDGLAPLGALGERLHQALLHRPFGIDVIRDHSGDFITAAGLIIAADVRRPEDLVRLERRNRRPRLPTPRPAGGTRP